MDWTLATTTPATTSGSAQSVITAGTGPTTSTATTTGGDSRTDRAIGTTSGRSVAVRGIRETLTQGDSRDRHDVRWLEREPPDRAFDPREPFTRGLTLPRGLEREIVRDRDRAYTLRGSETRTLATVRGVSSGLQS